MIGPTFDFDSNIIYNVDCLATMRNLPDKCFDHTITDPPFAKYVHENQSRFTRSCLMGNFSYDGSRTYKIELGFAGLSDEDRILYAMEITRLTKRWILVFSDGESIGDWRRAFEYAHAVWKRTCMWIKPTAQPQLSGDRPAQGYEAIATAYGDPGRSYWNGGGKVGIYYSEIPHEERFHPTQKPVQLYDQLVLDFTNPMDLIFDPFSGSGSLHVSARKLGRRSLGFELNEDYCRKANARIEKQEVTISDPSVLPGKKRAKQIQLFTEEASDKSGEEIREAQAAEAIA